jgi:hypothetical protein
MQMDLRTTWTAAFKEYNVKKMLNHPNYMSALKDYCTNGSATQNDLGVYNRLENANTARILIAILHSPPGDQNLIKFAHTFWNDLLHDNQLNVNKITDGFDDKINIQGPHATYRTPIKQDIQNAILKSAPDFIKIEQKDNFMVVAIQYTFNNSVNRVKKHFSFKRLA